ncbi:hypothetical protein B0H10DRAFT_107237 [Mycena sp. CBHHK59/15]|nr:hypothetical protein B0H10DRAFT_107237 [Mycena sp. CBHHK59/15]
MQEVWDDNNAAIRYSAGHWSASSAPSTMVPPSPAPGTSATLSPSLSRVRLNHPVVKVGTPLAHDLTASKLRDTLHGRARLGPRQLCRQPR